MSEQLSLNLLDPGPRRGSRPDAALRRVWFFAVMPTGLDAAHLNRLGAGLLQQAALSAKPRPEMLLHITLLGLRRGRLTAEDLVATARQVGAAVTDVRFDVVFTKAMSFGGGRRRPLVLVCSDGPKAALTGLHDRLVDLAADAGLRPPLESSFTPHLTLAYGSRAVPDIVLDEPFRWPAHELVLVCSLQGQSRYVIEDRWTFRPRPNQGRGADRTFRTEAEGRRGDRFVDEANSAIDHRTKLIANHEDGERHD